MYISLHCTALKTNFNGEIITSTFHSEQCTSGNIPQSIVLTLIIGIFYQFQYLTQASMTAFFFLYAEITPGTLKNFPTFFWLSF